jgi:hypothetical protein
MVKNRFCRAKPEIIYLQDLIQVCITGWQEINEKMQKTPTIENT